MHSHFPPALIFRALQAFGISAAFAVVNGLIGDITTRAERVGYDGLTSGVRMLAQAVGPVLGGLITEAFGLRSIFWFFLILGGMVLAALILFVPETHHSIAENGSARFQGFHRPLLYLWTGQPRVPPFTPSFRSTQNLSWRAPFTPLRMLSEKDVFCVLLSSALFFTAWSMATAATSTLFKSQYKMSAWQIGIA